MKVTHETWRGPVSIRFNEDGPIYALEREITKIEDWRETPFGPVNFGKVRFGPQRMVKVA